MMKKNMRRLSIVLAVALTSCQSLFSLSHVTPAPTPQCVEPTLALGKQKYRIESISRDPNTFPEIFNRKNDVAYWVEDTITHYVFALSPTKDNFALKDVLKAGDPVIIRWADCSDDAYVIQSVDIAQPNDLTIFDQSTGGITVYVRNDASSFVVRGERPVIQSVETPLPTEMNATRLDIQFSDLTPPDTASVKIGLKIINQGTQAVTLTNNDISLTAENSAEVFPLAIEPALPQEVPPGGNLSIAVTFPKPRASSAMLRILDTTFDYFFQ
jgi:hypothetical protein